MKENITSGQSGDCLVYLGRLIYIWFCARTMVCALYITNHKWRHRLSSNRMPYLVRVRGATVGVIVPNKEWDRSSFLIRLYGFVPLHPLLFMDALIPASRRSGSPVITRVSNSLTGGTGSRFIDGELGMF